MCKKKIQPIDDISGECPKWIVMVKLTKCPALFTADIRFATKDEVMHNLTLFKDVILYLLGTAPGSTRHLQTTLLVLPDLKLRCDRCDIVYSANRL